MAGRPSFRALGERIESLGGDDYIFGRIEDGDSITRIARDLETSRRMLREWRDQNPERAAAWHAAMKHSGEAHADLGMDELHPEPRRDDEGHLIPISTVDVQLMDRRSKYRQWLAGKRDPATFADKGLEINFSIGEIHLAAVAEGKALMAAAKAEPMEAEIIEEGTESPALAPGPVPTEASAEGPVEPLAAPAPPLASSVEDPFADLLA